MRDVWVTSNKPYVFVWVDGEIYETLFVQHGFLNWTQLNDIARGYAEALSWEIEYDELLD